MKFILTVLLLIAYTIADETKILCSTGTRDYDSDVLAEAAYGNLSGKGRVELQMCEESFNSQLIVAGQTNASATDYLVFMKGPSVPRWGARKDVNSATGAVLLQSAYVRVQDLKINGNADYPQGAITFSNASNFNVIDRCLITSTSATNAAGLIWPGTQATNLVVQNTAIICLGLSSTGWGIYQGGTFQNVLVKGFGNGVRDGVYKNCAVVGNGTAYTNAQAGSVTNASFAASAPGTGSLSSVTNWAFASDGYTFLNTSALYGVGTDLSGSYTTDINGDTWSAWSIGPNFGRAPETVADLGCTEGFCATINETNRDSLMLYLKSDTLANGNVKEYAFGKKEGVRASTPIVNGKFTQACSLTVSPLSSVTFRDGIDISGMSKFSFFGTFKQRALTASNRTPFGQYYNTSNRFMFLTNTTSKFVWWFDGATATVDLGSEFVAGRWHAMAAVYDGTQADNATRFRVWVDGVERTLTFTSTIPATKLTQTGYFSIAGNSGSFDGTVDEVAVWRGTLTDTQAKRLTVNGAIRSEITSIPLNTVKSWRRKTPITYKLNPIGATRDITLSVKDSTLTTTWASKSTTNNATDSNFVDSIPFVRGGWAKQYISMDYGGLPLLRDSSLYTFGIGPVILGAGQSNMVGYGEAPFTPTTQKASSFQLTTWTVLADSVGGVGGSMFPSFVNTLTPRINMPIGIISKAKTSTALWASPLTVSEWLYSASPLSDTACVFNRAAYHARLAGPVDAVFWYQGESDALLGHTRADYKDSLTKVINKFRDSLFQPDLPFFIVNLASASEGAVSLEAMAIIRSAIDDVDASVSNVSVPCRPFDLGYERIDAWHLNTESQRLLGVCMADATYSYYFPSSSTGGGNSILRRMGLSP
jgi:hypothetical protein